MSDNNEGWFWFSGSNDEWYQNGPCKTREQAILELDGEGGYIIEARQDPVKLSDYADLEGAIERAHEGSYDLIGEDGDPIFEVTPEQEKDLIARLKAAADQWQADHKLVFTPRMFTATRNAEKIAEGVSHE